MLLKTSLNLTLQPKPAFGRGWNLASAPGKTLADYQRMVATGANLARFGVVLQADLAGVLQFAPGTLQEADNHVRFTAQCGMHLVVAVCLDPWPSRTSTFWTTPSQQTSLVLRWQELVRALLPYRHLSFDILNEAQHDSWPTLVPGIIRAIRAVDPGRIIVYEPAPHASPSAFIDLTPLPFDGIVYSPHMYDPHPFTHQGIYDSLPPPDFTAGAATAALQPVVDFQQRYNVPVYVGEFGCVRWAVHRFEYLAEVLDVCNAQGWGWSYHAWGEWDGWDSQCNADRSDATRRVDEPTYQLLDRALHGIAYTT
jgi:hypothetical protein